VSKVNTVIGSAGQGTCTCGSDSKGTAYCSLFPGDSYKSKMFDMLAEYDQFSGKSKCNIDAAYTFGCMYDYWGKTNTYEFVYYQFMSNYYLDLINAESCTIKVFYSTYYDIKANYDDVADDSSSFSGMLKALSLIYLVS